MAKELCPENYKTLLKEIKEEKLIQKISPVYELWNLIILDINITQTVQSIDSIQFLFNPIDIFL